MAKGDGIFMTREQKINTYLMILGDSIERANSKLEQISMNIEIRDKALENGDNETAKKFDSLIKENVDMSKMLLSKDTNTQVINKLKELIFIEDNDND